ncbi:PREDICTED: uncharacterized protein LOC105586716 [Cercocebus atys]|uniref:uncharacterized protein LOC105586716 n=1 Tax=Cercocebus atys TaxID=9531 RepID=UPI0005F3BB42|nr:PREDICTED: uncharacterized protein LOC105586716 [Cercocebus atys]
MLRSVPYWNMCLTDDIAFIKSTRGNEKEPDETPGLTEGGREIYEEGILKNLLLGREDGKLSQSAFLHPIPQPHMPAHSRDRPTLLGKASELLPQDVLWSQPDLSKPCECHLFSYIT